MPAAKKDVKAAAPVAAKPEKTKVVKGPSEMFTKGGVIFEVTATIPTQQYGNIMPRIQVVCNTIQQGRELVMPVIEELYTQYAEKPRDGSRLSFQKAVVTETVKEIVPVPMPTVAPEAPVEAPERAPVQSAGSVGTRATEPAPAGSSAPVGGAKSEPWARAEKAIRLALTEDAAVKIKEQIEKSEKIPAHEKPELLELVEAKITDFQAEIW